MRTFLWVVFAVIQCMVLLTLSLRLSRYDLSPFNLKLTLQTYSGESAKLWRKFYKLLPDVKTFMWAKTVFMLVASVAILCQLFQPILGFVLGVLFFFVLRSLAQLSFLQDYSHKMFEKNLAIVVGFVEPLHLLWTFLGPESNPSTLKLASQEEFIDFLQKLPSTVLDPWQRQRIETVLMAEGKTVKRVMTHKKRVIAVSPTDTLGPIVLSDLQKTGHAFFPVIKKKEKIPEGVLRLNDMTDIHQVKQHTRVDDLMTTHIAWVDEDTKLFDLVQIFLQEKQHLLFVRDPEGNFTGIVTWADVIKHTLSIVQE